MTNLLTMIDLLTPPDKHNSWLAKAERFTAQRHFLQL